MDPASGSFKTHAGYLRAMAYLAGFGPFARETTVLTRLAREFSTAASKTAKPSGGLDRAQLRRSLHSAWGTEALLSITGEYATEELIALGNAWGTVQTYYSCYHATQATRGGTRSATASSHPMTQKLYVNFWVQPPRQLRLWSFGAKANGYRNLPLGRSIDESIHPWVTRDDHTCWDVAGKALRTTRQDALPAAMRRRREEKRRERRLAWESEEATRLREGKRPRRQPRFGLPHLTAAQKADVEGRLRPFGFLDYLYRLRIKAQYEDAAMFTDGPESESDSALVYRDLRRLTSSTLLLHEIHVKAAIGDVAFHRLVDERLSRHARSPSPLSQRKHLF